MKDEPMDALAIDSQVMVNILHETATRYDSMIPRGI